MSWFQVSSPNLYCKKYMKNSWDNSEADQRVKVVSEIVVATILRACEGEEWFDW